jgi:hypothetical protein
MDAQEALLDEALHLGVKGYRLKLSGSQSLHRFAFDHNTSRGQCGWRKRPRAAGTRRDVILVASQYPLQERDQKGKIRRD